MLPRADLPGNANSLRNMTLVSEVGKIPLAPNDICTVKCFSLHAKQFLYL